MPSNLNLMAFAPQAGHEPLFKLWQKSVNRSLGGSIIVLLGLPKVKNGHTDLECPFLFLA